MIEQKSSPLAITPYNVAHLELALIDPKSDQLSISISDDLSNCASPAAIVSSGPDGDHPQRRMSSSTASVPDTDSSVTSRHDKSHSPQLSGPSAHHLDQQQHHSWNFSPAAGTQHPDPHGGAKVQLPSISSLDGSFRERLSRSYDPRRDFSSLAHSNLGFSSPFDTHNPFGDRPAGRPRLTADTHLHHSYNGSSPYPPPTSLPSSTASSELVSSTYPSPLTPDPRNAVHTIPGMPYLSDDPWTGSASGIVRPTSTPGQGSVGSNKYDESYRHSISGPLSHPLMYGSAHRTPELRDRPKPEVSPFDFVLPPGNTSYYSSSTSPVGVAQQTAGGSSGGTQPPSPPSRSGQQQPPAPSTLVDRPTRKRGKLPKETTDYLKAWLHRHSDHPYPSEEEKKQLCNATGLSMSQVSNWMINARRRILAPAHRVSQAPTTTSTPYPPQGRSVNMLEPMRIPVRAQTHSQTQGVVGGHPQAYPASGSGYTYGMVYPHTEYHPGPPAHYPAPGQNLWPSHEYSGGEWSSQKTPRNV